MQKTKLSLGFSPCPNDCFIFDALIHGKIDTKELAFEPVIEDVETLNRMAFKAALDVTKLSYHAFAYLTDKYQLLNSGSALGFNCGPLLIGLPETINKLEKHASLLKDLKVAIPGKHTTANFLLALAFPQIKEKREMVFSEIESAVLEKKVDLGLIIHENRFTYEQKGLKKFRDLGEWWEETAHAAIPLGGIVVNRKLSPEIRKQVDLMIRKSVEYAFANEADVMGFVRQHAQEMSEEVMKKHIALYVNQYSIELGETGRKAVVDLFERAVKEKIIPSMPDDLFVQ